MNWILIALPLIAFGIGSTDQFRFLTNKQSFLIFSGAGLLIIFYLITNISFAYYFLNWTVVAIALFTLGYSGGNIDEKNSTNTKRLIKAFKIIMVLFYISLPIAAIYWVSSSLFNDWIGRTEKIERSNEYSITHTFKNGNFNYSGDHYVDVYKKILLIQYRVDHFYLGRYGQYELNSYSIEDNGSHPSINSFKYDPVKRNLVLYNYQSGQYTYKDGDTTYTSGEYKKIEEFGDSYRE